MSTKRNKQTSVQIHTYFEPSLPREVDSARLEVNLVPVDVGDMTDDPVFTEMLIKAGIHLEDFPAHSLYWLL